MDFKFNSSTKTIQVDDLLLDGRRFLRSLEEQLRSETGLPQIAFRFPPEAEFPGAELVLYTRDPVIDYDDQNGYTVTWTPLYVMRPDKGDEAHQSILRFISDHAKSHHIKPKLPSLPGKFMKMEDGIKLEPEIYKYEAIANDGGTITIFYTNSTSYFMLKQFAPLGIIHIQFQDKNGYQKYLASVKEDCSECKDLKGSRDDIIEQISVFNAEKNNCLEKRIG